MNYIEHLEAHCGESTGHLEMEELQDHAIQLLQFQNAPFANANTVTSLGLLHHPLQFENGAIVHQEVMISVMQPDAESDLIELVYRLTLEALKTGHAYDLGEYLPMPDGLLSKYGFAALYVTIPFYFEESFQVYKGNAAFGEPEAALPVWFVPIFASEVAYIGQYGTEEFNEMMYETEMQLLNLKRHPLVGDDEAIEALNAKRQLFVLECEITDAFFKDEIQRPLVLNGPLAKAYHMSVESGEQGDTDQNETFLFDFLNHQNRFPIYATFFAFEEEDQDNKAFFTKHHMSFTSHVLSRQKQTNGWLRGKRTSTRESHYFTIKIEDTKMLELILEHACGAGMMNELFMFSYSDHLSIQQEVETTYRKTRVLEDRFVYPEDTTVVIVGHDGEMLYLLSNEEHFAYDLRTDWAKRLRQQLPSDTVIRQLNGELFADL
ncbi:suppressor of fused domain protein [Exiguobacterium acetylicum]|uniref:suppressor of fused domain protein n=1 Tax=Exiguobacterium acetylicum TaxID=41170 RepID=UPI0004946883|nr:suppressor of fused domain protein [Exiguobacterium acetylicum]